MIQTKLETKSKHHCLKIRAKKWQKRQKLEITLKLNTEKNKNNRKLRKCDTIEIKFETKPNWLKTQIKLNHKKGVKLGHKNKIDEIETKYGKNENKTERK